MKRYRLLTTAALLTGVMLISNADAGGFNPPPIVYGTTAGTAAQGNDSRIVNAAPLSSPALTGTPTAPTATTSDSSTTIATTALAAAKTLVEQNRATSAENAIAARIPAASTAGTAALLIGGAAPTSVTYTKQVAQYVQIGPVIEFVIDVEWSALTAQAGAVTISGLPSGVTVTVSPTLPVAGDGLTVTSQPYGVVGTGGVISLLLSNGSTQPASDTTLASTALGSVGTIQISGRYFVG